MQGVKLVGIRKLDRVQTHLRTCFEKGLIAALRLPGAKTLPEAGLTCPQTPQEWFKVVTDEDLDRAALDIFSCEATRTIRELHE